MWPYFVLTFTFLISYKFLLFFRRKYKILQRNRKKGEKNSIWLQYILEYNLKMKMVFLVGPHKMCLLFNPVNFVCQDIVWLWFCVLRPRQPRYRRLAPRWKALRCSYPAGSLVWPDEAHDFPLKKIQKFRENTCYSHFLFFYIGIPI